MILHLNEAEINLLAKDTFSAFWLVEDDVKGAIKRPMTEELQRYQVMKTENIQ